MADGSSEPETDQDRVQRVADLAREKGARIAVAESLTAGRISAVLGQGEEASDWFHGAVVAYDEVVKFKVLGVTPGPVVTESCAREMAEGVRRLLEADVAVAITGVGGPGPDEGCPAGTMHLAVADDQGTRAIHAQVPGEPSDVVATATSLALEELVITLRDRVGR